MDTNEQLHPVLHIARQVVRQDGEKWILDDRGAQLLEMAILDHSQDPALKEVITTLFGMVVLFEESQSHDAATYLTLVLGTVAPAVRHLAGDVGEAQTLNAEQIREKARAILGTKSDATEKLSGKPPEGSISVRNLDIPPMPIPSKRRNSPAKKGAKPPPTHARRG